MKTSLLALRQHALIFPVTHALNFFSITILLVFLGLTGNLELAAIVGIAQSAAAALYMAFSGNARNIILSTSQNINEYLLYKKRLVLMLPVACASFLVCLTLIKSHYLLISFIVLRRGLEWLSEINLSIGEKNKNHHQAWRYVVFQAVLLFFLCLSILLLEYNNYIFVLLVWAVSPLVAMMINIDKASIRVSGIDRQLLSLFPHVGSTSISAISTFFFRVLLFILGGSVLAGELFVGFAIGAVIASFYTYSFGPSLIHSETLKQSRLLKMIIGYMRSVFFIACAACFFIAMLYFYNLFGQNVVLVCVVSSFLGSLVMIKAQEKKLKKLQVDNEDVFVPEILSNMAIVIAVPAFYYVFGLISLPFLYLFNSVITYLVYMSVNARQSIIERVNDSGHVMTSNILIVLSLLLIFIPVFFQLSGNIFYSKDLVFDSEGSLQKLPMPIGLFATFALIPVFAAYQRLKPSVTFIFFMFTAMVLGAMLQDFDTEKQKLLKFILLLQYILPMFALVLGNAYPLKDHDKRMLGIACLIVLTTILPVQYFHTLSSGYGLLRPEVIFFSIYQNLQYWPTVFVCFYLMSVFIFLKSRLMLAWVVLVGFFVVMNTAYSFSISAAVLLLSGCLLCAILFCAKKNLNIFKYVKYSLFLLMVIALLYLLAIHDNKYFILRLSKLLQSAQLDSITFRLDIWRFYIEKILDNPVDMLIGHSQIIGRDMHPSAHNYYLDIIYNFGILGIAPVIYLITYLVKGFVDIFQSCKSESMYTCMLFLISFILFFESMLKVSLRQPYSGVVMFFILGLGINYIVSRNICENKTRI